MSWTTTQTIEGPKEEPIFLRVSVGITRRWTNNHYFFVRKDASAKRVLAIFHAPTIQEKGEIATKLQRVCW
jgi:hypothetical protein